MIRIRRKRSPNEGFTIIFKHFIIHSDPIRRRYGHALGTKVIVCISGLLVYLRLVVWALLLHSQCALVLSHWRLGVATIHVIVDVDGEVLQAFARVLQILYLRVRHRVVLLVLAVHFSTRWTKEIGDSLLFTVDVWVDFVRNQFDRDRFHLWIHQWLVLPLVLEARSLHLLKLHSRPVLLRNLLYVVLLHLGQVARIRKVDLEFRNIRRVLHYSWRWVL